MVEQFEADCKAFVRHFMNRYYQYKSERLHLCRYVIHLVLHLPENVRRSGPISLSGQWSMEIYAGHLNQRCNATDRLAGSVHEGVRLELSMKAYFLRNGINLNEMYEDTETTTSESSNLQ